MLDTYFLLVYCDTSGSDPLFEVKQFDTTSECADFCRYELANTWNGPKIGMFRFNPAAHCWEFVGEVSQTKSEGE
jgi:hypothetical protein